MPATMPANPAPIHMTLILRDSSIEKSGTVGARVKASIVVGSREGNYMRFRDSGPVL